MKILVFSSLEMPYTIGARYTGLERLATEFAEQFAKLGHEVTMLAHKDNQVPNGVTLLPCEGYPDGNRTVHAEQRAFQRYESEFRKYDCVWDISNLHLPARFIVNLKSVNIFHANPMYAFQSGYIKAPYNLVSWSRWGIGQIARFYKNGHPIANGGQRAVYQETIMVDPNVYKPKGKRGDRYLTIGRMSPEKGNLNAILLCQELNLPLDVCGGRGSEHEAGDSLTAYEKQVRNLCDGKQIVFYGEVSDEQKIELMQSCRALLYITDHVEITSHKVQESMLCGAPVLIPNTGGMPEIVTNGVDGFLCSSYDDVKDKITKIDQLDPLKTRGQVAQKYDPAHVTTGYISLMEKVANGLKW